MWKNTLLLAHVVTLPSRSWLNRKYLGTLSKQSDYENLFPWSHLLLILLNKASQKHVFNFQVGLRRHDIRNILFQ